MKNRSFYTNKNLRIGDKVDVVYLIKSPETAKIKGMRAKPFPVFALISFLAPIVGIVLIAIGAFKGIKNISLIQIGELTQGRFINRVKNVSRYVTYTSYFSFTDKNGISQKASMTTSTEPKFDHNKTYTVFYDSQKPKKSIVLEALPGKIKYMADANYFDYSILTLIKNSIIPILMISGIFLFYYFIFYYKF